MRPIHRVVAALPAIALVLLAVPARASGGPPPPSDTPAASGASAQSGASGDSGTSAVSGSSTVSCSPAALITAINNANAAGGGTLTLARGCRYVLTAVQEGSQDGLPPIRAAITINGGGATVTRATGSSTPGFRIFEVVSPGALTLRSLTISNGSAQGPDPFGGGAIEVREGAMLSANEITVTGNQGSLGGGINNLGTAEIRSSFITRNQGLHGGGVSNSTRSGRLTLSATRVADNRATSESGLGGGVHNQSGGSVKVEDTTISGNKSDNAAGGILNDHDSVMTLTDTQISENVAGPLFNAPTVVLGGGIKNLGTMRLQATTVDRNRAVRAGSTLSRGGGIANVLSDAQRSSPPKLSLTSSRVVNNVADDAAGGVYNNQGSVELTDATITSNGPANCAGSPTKVSGCSN
jgi:hypothetical protein